MNHRRPGSFRDDFTVSLTLVSPCDGVPTVKTFPPPPAPPSDPPSSEEPTVFFVPKDSTPTEKQEAPTPLPVPAPTKAPVAFARGVAVGIAMTSIAMLAIAIAMGAPAAWRGVTQVRPVAMHLVEHLTARRAAPEPNAKPAPRADATTTSRAHATSHRDRTARERVWSRPLRPSKRILEEAL